jgi:E3 ubiquitin-protein ligase HUWE1
MAPRFVNRNGLYTLFRRLRKSAVTGGSSYVASVLRHVVEDAPIIQSIMQQNIRGHFSQARRVRLDLPTYVRNCSAIALRDMDLFINVTKNMCLVENPYSSPHIKLLAGIQPSDKAAVPAEIPTDMQVDNPRTSSTCSIRDKSVEVVIHLLVNEVMNTAKSVNETPSASASDAVGDGIPEANDQASPPVDDQDRQQYLSFVMQCLTELLFSYDSCKLAFLSYSSKKRSQQSQTKEPSNKFRTTTLHFFLSDIITYSTINPASDPKYRQRAALCSWAMNVIGALCVDTSAVQETKEISSDLLLVRKFTLETISRAIKEISSTTEGTEARYGRLLALADLCHRLLTVRVNRKQQQDDISTHLAKIMLEKNFVATLTSALAEVDLNYPNVRNLVASVLRPLENL